MPCRCNLARRPVLPPPFSGVSRGTPPSWVSSARCCSTVRPPPSFPVSTPESSGGRTGHPLGSCSAVARGGALASFHRGLGSHEYAPVDAATPRRWWEGVGGNFCGAPRLRTPRSILAKTLGSGEVLAKIWVFSNGLPPKSVGNSCWAGVRDFSTGTHHASDASGRGTGKTLPWIAGYDDRERKGSRKRTVARDAGNSWEESADGYFSRTGGKSMADNREHGTGTGRMERMDMGRGSSMEEQRAGKEDDREEDAEPIDDPRWNRIKSKYDRFVSKDARYERPELVQWNRQENWGRKTWKQATESSVPKMVGEGVYGVGPVLAALTAQRRELYSLYVQEGLDLSGNNKKKKDKKGVEKILKIAEEIGLTVKEASKHDLNMVVDNRPHQGLVLDASPLEMVGVRELDPVLMNKGHMAPVWVALDEVTDPQNLGAILRSAYFFGVEGVVLCAKNSAPLSGVVSKASAGSLELIELRACKNMMQFLTLSVENGWRVLGGSVSSKALPLCKFETGVPTILVLGSEGTGLRPLVERSCTQLVKIPGNISVNVHGGGSEEEEEGEEMDGKSSTQHFKSFLAVESLNVSVAAGVLLYHLVGDSSMKQCESTLRS